MNETEFEFSNQLAVAVSQLKLVAPVQVIAPGSRAGWLSVMEMAPCVPVSNVAVRLEPGGGSQLKVGTPERLPV